MKSPLIQSPHFMRLAAPTLVGLFLLGFWEFACWRWNIPVFLLPKPSDIARSLSANWPDLLRALGVTMSVTLEAFVSAVVLGSLLAFVFAQSRAVEVSLFP
jgi:NitT/TauT family transport system permease protein